MDRGSRLESQPSTIDSSLTAAIRNCGWPRSGHSTCLSDQIYSPAYVIHQTWTTKLIVGRPPIALEKGGIDMKNLHPVVMVYALTRLCLYLLDSLNAIFGTVLVVVLDILHDQEVLTACRPSNWIASPRIFRVCYHLEHCRATPVNEER
jgi:hypothetical protein